MRGKKIVGWLSRDGIAAVGCSSMGAGSIGGKKYCGNLLWQSSLTLLPPRGLQPEKLHDVNVSDWLADNKTKALRKALRYEDMRDFLEQEASLAGVVEYLDSLECKNIREWLNDAVHLNYYKTILLNNGQVCIDGERKTAVDELKHAFDRISMFHVTCVFCLQSIYMMSSDYSDYIDCGMKPPEGCQYDVAPFVQSYLDETVYRTFPDWAGKLVETAAPMRLRKVGKVDGSKND